MRTLKTITAGAALLAGAVILWMAVAFRQDLDTHRTRVASGSRVVETACGPVELAEAGSGPAVLLVHGTGGGFDQGMSAGKHLAARGLRVIAPSRFGYLRTPYPADPSAEAQADQFACLLEALGVGPVAVIGISAGANSAMQFAIRHPARTTALILLVPAAYNPANMETAEPPFAERLLMRIVTSDLLFWLTTRFAEEAAIRMVLATAPAEFRLAPASEQERARTLLDEILPISARRAGIVNDARLARRPPRYALEAIRAPTLAISVRDDLFGTHASAEYSARHIPSARFISYERGGHVWLGHHEQVMDETSAFILGGGRSPGPAR
jgi:2-hydroxy-6-oxonona-2,4-dienedioate hydrolase